MEALEIAACFVVAGLLAYVLASVIYSAMVP